MTAARDKLVSSSRHGFAFLLVDDLVEIPSLVSLLKTAMKFENDVSDALDGTLIE